MPVQLSLTVLVAAPEAGQAARSITSVRGMRPTPPARRGVDGQADEEVSVNASEGERE
jgi:hypothetical protein